MTPALSPAPLRRVLPVGFLMVCRGVSSTTSVFVGRPKEALLSEDFPLLEEEPQNAVACSSRDPFITTPSLSPLDFITCASLSFDDDFFDDDVDDEDEDDGDDLEEDFIKGAVDA